jgi:hypothetical protein
MLMKCDSCQRLFPQSNGITCEICGRSFCENCCETAIAYLEFPEFKVVLCQVCNNHVVDFEEILEAYKAFELKLWNWRRREVLDEMVIDIQDLAKLLKSTRQIHLQMIETTITLTD